MDDESGEFMERAELVCVGRSESYCIDGQTGTRLVGEEWAHNRNAFSLQLIESALSLCGKWISSHVM